MTASVHYLLADGDAIGDQIELCVLDNRLSEAGHFSACIRNALAELVQITEQHDGRVVFAGGDAILCSLPSREVARAVGDRMRIRFREITSRSLSVGLGSTAAEALGHLRRAKLSGKDRLVED